MGLNEKSHFKSQVKDMTKLLGQLNFGTNMIQTVDSLKSVLI
jgi:hypothetical protein